MSKKLNLTKILLMLLSASSIGYGTEDTKERAKTEGSKPAMSETREHGGCQTYIPKPMKFKRYDKQRDVALYIDESRMSFWDRLRFIWASDKNTHH